MNNLDDIINFLISSGQQEMADKLRQWVSRHTRLKGEYMGMLTAVSNGITVNVYVEGEKVKIDTDAKKSK